MDAKKESQPKKKRGRPRKSSKRSQPPKLPQPAEPVNVMLVEENLSSPASSTSSYSPEPLSPETQRLLAAVPEHIGDSGPTESGASAGEPELLVAVAVPALQISPEMFKGVLRVFLKMVARWRDFDRYNIGDEDAALLSGPGAQVMNVCLDKLAPAFLKQFAISCPGLGELILASGLVFAPIIQADFERDRASEAKRMVKPGVSHADPVAPKRSGMIYNQGGEN